MCTQAPIQVYSGTTRDHFLSVPGAGELNDTKQSMRTNNDAQGIGKSVTSERNYDYHDKFNYWMAGISRLVHTVNTHGYICSARYV